MSNEANIMAAHTGGFPFPFEDDDIETIIPAMA
jgi:hypothetical protein